MDGGGVVGGGAGFGGGNGSGAGPFAIITVPFELLERAVLMPIAPTSIPKARTSAPNLRDIVPPWNR